MSRPIKLLLSILGISAIVIPAALLMYMSANTKPSQEVSTGSRQLNTKTVEDAVKRAPPPVVYLPSPIPASASASPKPSAPAQ